MARLVVACAVLLREPAGAAAQLAEPKVAAGGPYLQATGLNVTAEDAAPQPPQGVVLLRIQKTASTSFGDHILAKQCAARGLNCQVYWHLDWDLVAHSPAYPRHAVVTWLRHPLERLVSEYEYIKAMRADRQVQWDYSPAAQAGLAKGARSSLAEFVRMPHNPAHNRMLRYVLGFARPALGCYEACGANWAAFFERGGEDPGAQLEQAVARVGEAELLRVAKHRLSRTIQIVGITDCFDSSIVLVGKQLGWDAAIPQMLADAKVHYRAGGRNASATETAQHRPELARGLAAEIEAANRLDMELYLHARSLVNSRMEQLGAGVRCETAAR